MFPQFTNQNRCVGISCECGFDIYLGVQTYANKLTRQPAKNETETAHGGKMDSKS